MKTANLRDYRASDYVEELLRLLDWPVDRRGLVQGLAETHSDPIAYRAHHAGRVRALAWVVTGIDWGQEVLDRRDEVKVLLVGDGDGIPAESVVEIYEPPDESRR